MAKLTPLAKGLIAIAIVGGTSAAAWKLGLRDIRLVTHAESGDIARAGA